jgi:uncharacterized LabA/DUF88 family protein
MATAILVDGGFFLKRFRTVYKDRDHRDPSMVAKTMHNMARMHLYSRRTASTKADQSRPRSALYRIFFYDCPPIHKKAHKPISKKSFDFGRSEEALFRQALHNEIRKLRKTALRLGTLSEDPVWTIKPGRMEALLKRKMSFSDLTDDDFIYYAKQKGVDMRIGLDIAALSYKRLVSQIVLVAGDSDFVPAAKLARREGIDFILDPMWNHIHADLTEHIDGLISTCPNPYKIPPATIAKDEILPNADLEDEFLDSAP